LFLNAKDIGTEFEVLSSMPHTDRPDWNWKIVRAPLNLRIPCAAAVSAAVLVCLLPASALAQDRIYKCGNTYTNKKSETHGKNCVVFEGGNLTVVQSGRSAPSGGTETKAADKPSEKSADQKARDSDAKAILEEELRKSEQKLAELQKEYNNGQPEKVGIESRNYQRYLDRVEELKNNIARTESDIAGIKREIARLR
jgi:hypothetical protein